MALMLQDAKSAVCISIRLTVSSSVPRNAYFSYNIIMFYLIRRYFSNNTLYIKRNLLYED